MPVMVDATNDGRGDAMPGRGDGRTVPTLGYALILCCPQHCAALEGDGRYVPERYLREYLTDYGLSNTLEGTVGSSCPVRRDLHAWRLLNLQPLAALAGRPQQWHNLGNTPLRDGRQVGSQDARRIENRV